MALFPKTPGVYIQEIPTLPPSVAPVATAIPVFIGYTEKGTPGTVMSAVRIESLVEFTQFFGGPYIEQYTASVSGTVTIPPAAPGTAPITSIAYTSSQFVLYRNMQMFYANGGGDCYVISVGNYTNPIAETDLVAGINKAEEVDEITLIVIPEATNTGFTGGQFQAINDTMLDQCNKLQDRFAILDVPHSSTIVTDANNFRNSYVSANFLKYGASYYPPLKTILPVPFSDVETIVSDTRTGTGYPVFIDSLANGPFNNLFSIKNGFAAWARIVVGGTVAVNDTVTIRGIVLTAGIDFTASATAAVVVDSLKKAINNNSSLQGSVVAITAGQASGKIAVIATNSVTSNVGYSISESSAGITVEDNGAGLFHSVTGGQQDTTLYNNFLSLLNANLLTVHPSATMAGIYASVDRDRGVWKAPANVSVNFVDSLTVTITDDDQAGLNVDPVGGKSINAIRNFTGRGNLVWGSRTLAGNDNEWRYVPVRRLFIMAEESIKKASEFVVFEPNDKNTWIRVKGTITNFLLGLWRDGALTGDKPEQAFFVKVGLNETMTAQDILEGRLIIQVGLAAVRPAEFIILQFSHKLQEA